MRKFDQNRGFTLIEITVASLIILPMLVLLMRLVPSMLQNQSQTELTSMAIILASQKM